MKAEIKSGIVEFDKPFIHFEGKYYDITREELDTMKLRPCGRIGMKFNFDHLIVKDE